MCESTAYLITKDGEKKVMENVVNMKPENGKVYLTGLLGDQKIVEGKIEEIKLIEHKILISQE
ncbi:CooT family nickel-binding protein [Thermohalobacter berrensis]|uniref:RNA-binding protein n=1 Tax=Thermohalobacter berrensis TaxID=99594 RepID=A0A419T8G5_9FIRM|nr:CooT family nickel-binding protein [Thermohalobacter berrensis]RKD33771.1 RNA-binding protein [Thermohalobacter berrensis]